MFLWSFLALYLSVQLYFLTDFLLLFFFHHVFVGGLRHDDAWGGARQHQQGGDRPHPLTCRSSRQVPLQFPVSIQFCILQSNIILTKYFCDLDAPHYSETISVFNLRSSLNAKSRKIASVTSVFRKPRVVPRIETLQIAVRFRGRGPFLEVNQWKNLGQNFAKLSL